VSQPLVLDPALLTTLGDLELIARVTVDGTLSGLHDSPFHGYSAEFNQYRQYRPGDDLKYVDWKLFARTDRFYTKQYQETTNLAAQVVVDASRSMAYGRGHSRVAKMDYARLVAASLSYLISRQGDAVGLVVYNEAIRQYLPSKPGQTHLRRLLVTLSKIDASGATSTAAALRRSVDLLSRRGLILIISDLYDEDEAVERELRRAVRIGHDVAVFHVLTRDELEFPFAHDVELEELESGRKLLAGPGAAAAYRRAFAEFLERWRARCARERIDYTRILTDAPLDVALRDFLRRRSGGVVS
jgi:uncharacterized protein (DUF58 family)